MFDGRHVNVHDLVASVAQFFQCLLKPEKYVCLCPLFKKFAWHTYLFECSRRHGSIRQCGRVVLVMSTYDIKDDLGIGNGFCERSYLIERRSQCYEPEARNSAVGSLE